MVTIQTQYCGTVVSDALTPRCVIQPCTARVNAFEELKSAMMVQLKSTSAATADLAGHPELAICEIPQQHLACITLGGEGPPESLMVVRDRYARTTRTPANCICRSLLSRPMSQP